MILCQAFGPFLKGLISFRLPLYEVFRFCVFFLFEFFKFFVFFTTSFFSIILWSNLDRPKCCRFLRFPYWQSNFIKLFNGGLQYEFIRTFYYAMYSCCKYFDNSEFMWPNPRSSKPSIIDINIIEKSSKWAHRARWSGPWL